MKPEDVVMGREYICCVNNNIWMTVEAVGHIDPSSLKGMPGDPPLIQCQDMMGNRRDVSIDNLFTTPGRARAYAIAKIKPYVPEGCRDLVSDAFFDYFLAEFKDWEPSNDS